MEESLLNFNQIKILMKKEYNLDIISASKMARGTATIYEIYTTDKHHYILKEFQSKYSKIEVEKEIAIINHLHSDGLKVPTYIQTQDGKFSTIANERTIIVQEFIEGYILPQNGGNYDQTIESAKYLGLIVKSLENLEYVLPEIKASSWYSNEEFEESIKKFEDVISKCKDDEKGRYVKSCLLDKINMIKSLNVNTKDLDKVTYKNSHGDYSMMQFIYQNGEIHAIIDFASASRLPIVWEIARSYSYIDEKCKDGNFDLDNFIDYVKEFNKYIKLSKYDLKYMSYLYMIQLLNSSYGFKQYVLDNSKIDLFNFGCLRYNITKYLYTHAEEISNRLLEEVK